LRDNGTMSKLDASGGAPRNCPRSIAPCRRTRGCRSRSKPVGISGSGGRRAC